MADNAELSVGKHTHESDDAHADPSEDKSPASVDDVAADDPHKVEKLFKITGGGPTDATE